MTSIEWTDKSWNPVTGCDRVSSGCRNCYALDLAARLKAMGQPRYQRDGQPPTSGPGFALTLHPDKLEEPLRWRKPRMVFVNSMSDLFHPEVPESYIAQVFGVMARAPAHTFQVLTKRPERMREVVPWLASEHPGAVGFHRAGWPLPNVWLGTSIESRTYVGRADHLRATPAAVRFISAEPLLGPLVHNQIYDPDGDFDPDFDEPEWEWSDGWDGPQLDLAGIAWLIVGGESGPNHRPIDPQWVRDLRDYARAHGPDSPAFFFKQWGGRTPKAGGRELDGRTWDEFPEPTREAVAA